MNSHLERILNNVSKSVEIDNGDLGTASERVLNSVIEGLNVARCGIWMFEPERGGIKCFLLIDNHNNTRSEDTLLSRDDFPQYFRALDTERAIVANDAHKHPDTCEFTHNYLKPLGISSMLDTPIRHSGKMAGIICSEHIGEERQWSEDEVVFASVLSDLFGRAINAKERCDYELKLIDANKNLEQKIAARTSHLEETILLLKRMQVKLIESEKMASLGSLVAGVAHEVNTPIGVSITANSHHQGQVQQLEKKFKEDDLSYEDLEDYIFKSSKSAALISENLNRAANLIQNFKKTAVDQLHIEAEPIILKEYTQQILATLKPLTKKRLVQFNISGPNSPLTTYAGAIAQILTNFISNSCEHAFAETSNENIIDIIYRQLDDNHWEMDYRDNGKGMPKSTLDKIYDPFFTTARASGGSGLGMSIVYNLITQKLNGSIEAYSEQGKGTRFNVIFKEITL
ncbi:GAF domain-containing protein [Alteromonadaceae bacterium Bs31]|nr:GAF domain-containing protein [Alteromonadaceae bacterium Bs31]